ncbi:MULTISPECIES: hypothetical protein [Bacillaceae]|uniref:hypothetical protein n=1 Tax=Shouchella oshimensis TaxID=290588 RepID=UPI000ACDC908|nr:MULTISPECIES: hypothetical protein [Bacillaceae]
MIDKLLSAVIYKYKDTHLYELAYAEVEGAYPRIVVEKENNTLDPKKFKLLLQ